MNSQLSFAVTQIHQQELRQAAAEARSASQPRSRTRLALPRHFRFTARTRPAVAPIATQPRTV